MKILYFSPHPHINLSAPSGPGTHIREVIAGFEAQGHRVVRFIAGGEKLDSTTKKIDFKKRSWKKLIPPIIWETLRDIQMVLLDRQIEVRLTEVIQAEKPDIIYERSCYGMGAGMRAAKKLGIRYVVEMNAPYPEEKVQMQGKSLIRFLGIRHEKTQVTNAFRTIVVSSAMKNYLIRKTNVDPSKIVVLANAVNPSHIQSNPILDAEIRSRFGLKNTHIVFGFVGSIFPYHGVDIMIESFSTLEKENDNLRMLIVGDGEILPDLKRRVTELKLGNKIYFTGNVVHDQVYDYLKIMDITIMARSNWYGSPVKIFEYGAMQKAIIAPRVVPVLDVMQHEIDGLLIEASQAELTKSMRFMIDHPEQRNSMAITFHEKVMREHTWNRVAKQILDACQ
jgi:glycosyltransferase involved in cell wall biosynthesis